MARKASKKPKEELQPITPEDVPQGWYGLVVIASYSTLDEVLTEASEEEKRPDAISLYNSVIKTLKARPYGSVVFPGAVGKIDGLMVVQKLPTHGVVGLFTMEDWRGDSPAEAFAKVTQANTNAPQYPIAIRYMALGNDGVRLH